MTPTIQAAAAFNLLCDGAHSLMRTRSNSSARRISPRALLTRMKSSALNRFPSTNAKTLASIEGLNGSIASNASDHRPGLSA